MSAPWYPRDPRKALDGMRHLSLELRGAYGTILDLIYDRRAPIPDDDLWIAGWMGVSPRKWRLLRQALLDDGRIIVRGDGKHAVISDEEADKELKVLAVRLKTNSDNGAIGGKISAERRSDQQKNNGLDEAVAKPTAQAPLKLRHIEENQKEPPKAPQGVPELELVSSTPDEPPHRSLNGHAVAFDRAWSAYPQVGRRRSNKPKAAKEWPSASRKIGGDEALVAAIERFSRSDDAMRENGQYVPAFERWLQAGRFEHWTADERPSRLEVF